MFILRNLDIKVIKDNRSDLIGLYKNRQNGMMGTVSLT
jgi:hypothetical protein